MTAKFLPRSFACRVLVLMGGPDAEREVSIMSGTEVAKALRSRPEFDVLEVMVNELNFSVESFQSYFEFNLFRRTPLICAIQEGNSDVAKFLLENLKANPNNCEAIFSAIDKDVER